MKYFMGLPSTRSGIAAIAALAIEWLPALFMRKRMTRMPPASRLQRTT